jgi:hypothetical protein
MNSDTIRTRPFAALAGALCLLPALAACNAGSLAGPDDAPVQALQASEASAPVARVLVQPQEIPLNSDEAATGTFSASFVVHADGSGAGVMVLRTAVALEQFHVEEGYVEFDDGAPEAVVLTGTVRRVPLGGPAGAETKGAFAVRVSPSEEIEACLIFDFGGAGVSTTPISATGVWYKSFTGEGQPPG